MKISKIEIECCEHEDVVYWRWNEDDWWIENDYQEIIQLTEGYEWLEDLYQTTKRKKRLECLDDLDVMMEVNG